VSLKSVGRQVTATATNNQKRQCGQKIEIISETITESTEIPTDTLPFTFIGRFSQSPGDSFFELNAVELNNLYALDAPLITSRVLLVYVIVAFCAPSNSIFKKI